MDDFYTLFSRFWWLIFPLFWMGAMAMSHWSRHARANRALDILKSYADQGKDPPPELMKSLQIGRDDDFGWRRRSDWGWRYSPEWRLHRTFLFTGLAIAFGFLTYTQPTEHRNFGLLIPTLIFTALAVSHFLSLLFLPRGGWPPDDKDRR